MEVAYQTRATDGVSMVSDPVLFLWQDWLDIDFAIGEGVDFIAVSFVKSADVIINLKSYLSSRSDKVIEVIAKVESFDSVPNLQDIVDASDAVMVARGDLGTALHSPIPVQATHSLKLRACFLMLTIPWVVLGRPMVSDSSLRASYSVFSQNAEWEAGWRVSCVVNAGEGGDYMPS